MLSLLSWSSSGITVTSAISSSSSSSSSSAPGVRAPWDAKGSASESESRAGREKAAEPDARVVDFVVDFLVVLVEGPLGLGVFLTEEADGRGGLNGFGGILKSSGEYC